MASIEEMYMAQGMPFERRCELAREMLLDLQGKILQTCGDTLENRQQDSERAKSFLENLQGEARQQVAQIQEDHQESDAKIAETSITSTWKVIVDFTRLMYGHDAVEFALETIKNKNPGN